MGGWIVCVLLSLVFSRYPFLSLTHPPTHPTQVHNLLGSLSRCSKITRPNSRGFVSSLDLRELPGMDEPGCRPTLQKSLTESASGLAGSMKKNLSFGDLSGSGRGKGAKGGEFGTSPVFPPTHPPTHRSSFFSLITHPPTHPSPGEQPIPEPLQSPTAPAMTWATYVETIKEGNEDDGIFF